MAQYQNIHWFPGHMKVALDGIKKMLPQIDLIIEIGDARAPLSSLNTYLETIVKDKEIVTLYSKSDLCDIKKLNIYLDKLKKNGKFALAFDFKNPRNIKELVKYLTSIKTPKQQKYERLGLAIPPLRALIVGIPNVGKSTLINSLVGSKKASVANTPGHTKAQQMIKVSNTFVLFDTPGVLEPNYEDKSISLKLAWLGSIKTEILPLEELTDTLVEFIKTHYLTELNARYSLAIDEDSDISYILEQVALSRKFMKTGNNLDIERTRMTILKDFQNGNLGKVIVDDVETI